MRERDRERGIELKKFVHFNEPGFRNLAGQIFERR